MSKEKREIDVVEDISNVHQEIGNLYFLNAIVWIVVLCMLIIYVKDDNYAEIYHVEGIKRTAFVKRVWGLPDSDFKNMPQLQENGAVSYHGLDKAVGSQHQEDLIKMQDEEPKE